jgi:excisionase family DNA binding protein
MSALDGSPEMTLTVALTAEQLDGIALRVAAILADQQPAQASSAWLDVEQAAAHLACPKSRLYALVSAGRIPHCKDGSRLLFNRAELDKWVRGGGGKRP